MTKLLAILTFTFAITSTVAFAQPSEGTGPQGPAGGKRGPPKEALEACSGKKSGEACTFTGRNKENLTGTCWSPETSKPLACKPANHPEGQEQKK